MTEKQEQAKLRSRAGIPAVTIRQPQAGTVLVRPGPIEQPGWRTDYRGPLLIHAAKRGAGDPPVGKGASPAYSALLGVVDLVDCIATERAGGGPDEIGYVWILANPRSFASSIPYIGRLGLFEVPNIVVAAALAALDAG